MDAQDLSTIQIAKINTIEGKAKESNFALDELSLDKSVQRKSYFLKSFNYYASGDYSSAINVLDKIPVKL